MRFLEWWQDRIDGLRRRWLLARHGEVMILNAIDAIDAAVNQLHPPVDRESVTHAAMYLGAAMAHLKHVIDYKDEPEPTFPDEHEADGLLHVIPKDYA